MHVAGGFTDPGGVYWDTHAHDVVDDVLDLLARTLDLLGQPAPPVLLERDTDVDDAVVRSELERVRRAVARVHR